MPQALAIGLTDLTVSYGGRLVLDRLCLEVPWGARVVLTGESGSGKSTVLRVIMGFVQPAAGTVEVDGLEVTPRSCWAVRRRLAWVPQEPDLLPGSVSEVLSRPRAYQANAELPHPDPRLESWLERLLLPRQVLAEPISSLSGGERQRVVLLMALQLQRPILLLDEATSALDERSAEAVVALLREQEGLTVVAVAHDEALRSLGDDTVELTRTPEPEDV